MLCWRVLSFACMSNFQMLLYNKILIHEKVYPKIRNYHPIHD